MNTQTNFRTIFGVDAGFPAPGADTVARFARIYLEAEPASQGGVASRRYLLIFTPGTFDLFGAWLADLVTLAGGGTLQFADQAGQPTGDPFALVPGLPVSTTEAAAATGVLTVDGGGLILLLNAPEGDFSLFGCPNKPCDKPNSVPGIAPR